MGGGGGRDDTEVLLTFSSFSSSLSSVMYLSSRTSMTSAINYHDNAKNK